MALHLRYVAHSETGLVRKNNQDSGYASPSLLVVADGMGGAAAGDLASAVAVDTIRRIDPSRPEAKPAGGDSMLEQLAGALHEANDQIADLVHTDGALDGMGTTVTGALFDGTELGLAHIGDSRAYLLRDGHLERLTHDHSWVQSLVDDGKISEAEAALHPHRSLLLRVLNGQPASEPDLTRVPVRAGDRLLFCSDGVCGLVEDPAIAEALQRPDLEAAQAALVEAAHAAGGIDNITLIVADVVVDDGSSAVAVLGAAGDRDHANASVDTAVTEVVADGPEPATPAAAAVAAATSAADDEARYNPRAPHRRNRRRRNLAAALVAVLLLAAGVGAGWAWTRSQFYVGAAEESVAIFQGVAEALPGVRLSTVYEVQDLPVASLPAYYQERVRAGIGVASLEAARQTVGELAEAAMRCAASQPPAQPTGSPSASRTPAPSAVAPSASATATAEGRSTPAAPTPSAGATPGATC
ncbi:MAG: PP2C family protein-serine/threonine phosphatase [Actinomycetes bacterium]